MPSSTCNGEKVEFVIDVAQNIQGRMMLEEQVHLNTNTSNIFEHVGELHVLWVRSITIEAVQWLASVNTGENNPTYIS